LATCSRICQTGITDSPQVRVFTSPTRQTRPRSARPDKRAASPRPVDTGDLPISLRCGYEHGLRRKLGRRFTNMFRGKIHLARHDRASTARPRFMMCHCRLAESSRPPTRETGGIERCLLQLETAASARSAIYTQQSRPQHARAVAANPKLIESQYRVNKDQQITPTVISTTLSKRSKGACPRRPLIR